MQDPSTRFGIVDDAQGADRVRIFDTTLRDGEQSPGATMTHDEKVAVARQLDRLGVDVIEAGFPIASDGELEAVQAIAAAVRHAEVAALCRTREGDIRRAWEAVSTAVRPRLHTFIATSDIHLTHKLRMTRAQVLDEVRRGVAMCRSLCERVEFSAEDATRTDIDFLCEVARVAVDAGATVINVPDTVGYAMPWSYKDRIAAVVEAVGGRAIVSAHCHDDLGLAVANSLAAIAGGARQVEVCVNGIGERAGNAALEEVVMALVTRHDENPVVTGIHTQELVPTSRMVAEVTGMAVPANKAVVGRNAFAHESGIHQHGVLSERTTYEIMSPESVGWQESSLVLGKHSGRHALRHRLDALGHAIQDHEIGELFTAFKALCDRRKAVYDDDLHTIVRHVRDVSPRAAAGGGR